jgi:carbonic anhydrase/acetyltransferase-like protein (isoleucine patch superfamily)
MEKPILGKNVYIAEGAIVKGNVTLGDDVNVWFNAVIRADREPVVIGKGTNVQDNSTVHVETGAAVHIGENVTIGHNAVIHGCTIGDNSLVGMGAVIMNNAVIGKNCIIGAGALVTQNQQIPDGSLVMGFPASVVRQLREDEIKSNAENAAQYVAEAAEYSEEKGSH